MPSSVICARIYSFFYKHTYAKTDNARPAFLRHVNNNNTKFKPCEKEK